MVVCAPEPPKIFRSSAVSSIYKRLKKATPAPHTVPMGLSSSVSAPRLPEQTEGPVPESLRGASAVGGNLLVAQALCGRRTTIEVLGEEE